MRLPHILLISALSARPGLSIQQHHRALASSFSGSAAASSSASASLPSSVPASTTSESSVPSSSVVSVSVSFSSSASATSTSTSSAATPSTSTVETPDVETIHERRLSGIVGAVTGVSNIARWLSTQTAEGNWPDVDYTTGCPARRANWPAQGHWQHLLTMSAAYHGGLEGADQYVKQEALGAAISKAMDWWFTRDITNIACLDFGGSSPCPCSDADTTLWNTNWFSNIILIPNLVAQTCLLFQEKLTDTQRSKCIEMTSRSYAQFGRSINGVGQLTGANTLDVARIGIDLGILTANVTLATDAYTRVHGEMVVQNTVMSDGVRADGSFGQHGGILYNGNYGKDYMIDIVDMENEAADTAFSAGPDARATLDRLFEGDTWMIFRNVKTGVLHFDFSVLGRFISFPVIDQQATGSIQVNLTAAQELGEKWDSEVITNFATSLSAPSRSANAGGLLGNQMFYTNDYMVHRGTNYVTSLKMYSSRTRNTECTNLQNPLGFHLSDGTVYTYLQGDEYEDIAAVIDWSKIAGTTSDDSTPLNCGSTQFRGKEAFVGGASDGKIGVAAMRYTNPATNALAWQKAWFFLEKDVQHVMISNISSSSNSTVVSVLDQRRHVGDVYINSKKVASTSTNAVSHPRTSSLWHGDVGYVFPQGSPPLSVQTGEKTGNWSAIGTSTQPPATVDLFTAWLSHENLATSVSYTAFPGTTLRQFKQKERELQLTSLSNDGKVAAVYDHTHQTIMSVFWGAAGGSVEVPLGGLEKVAMKISSTGNIALIYKVKSGEVVVSDPSQNLTSVDVTFAMKPLHALPHGWSKTLRFNLPTGGLAGSSISKNLFK